MITKEQALNASEFHYGECTRTTGPRGGVQETVERWRRSGSTQVWKTRTRDFRVPVKYGMRNHSAITQYNAHEFHTEDDCPLNKDQ